MKTLKKIISTYMYQITSALIIVILLFILLFQIYREHKSAYEGTLISFFQIEQILTENKKELEEIQNEYRQTCLHNTETVARIIESSPSVLDSPEDLKDIAHTVEIDEIHIFDTTGRIFTGTHPQYYNLTFDSGEQMMFFKPMLTDKSLKLVQDITPNTAEAKPMQYSAIWSKNGEFIVQVGMEPVNVIKITEKNELSYIFSLLRVNPLVDYYAINPETEKIIGSTKLGLVGDHISKIGLTIKDISRTDAFHANVNNHHSFCAFTQIDGNYIGRVIAQEVLYQRIPTTLALMLSVMLLIAFLLSKATIRHMNKYVVNEIQDVNEKLQSITNGNFEETVNIQSSVEFSALSSYLNMMVSSLLENNRKMTHVLNKTNLYIGIYEYNIPMNKIHFTEHIPKILALTPAQENLFSMDISAFIKFLDNLRKHPFSEEEEVYQNGGQYIRLEEIITGQDVFGVAIDITSEINKRREIEHERDMDMLTGLYNRRGFEGKLSDLRYPESLKHSVLIMIDADGLKSINDTYGHEKGDIYIKSIAEILRTFGRKNSIVSRMGGDEFVLFLYGYDRWEALQKEVDNLLYIQSHHTVQLDKDIEVPVRFSMGYCFSHGSINYQQLLKEADERMYQNKLERKKKTP